MMRVMDMDGIVIAGGGGRRLGGPKAAATLGGTTLVELAVSALAAHCRRVLVVTRPGVPVAPVAAEVVFDRPGPDAPLTGLATGLAAAGTPEVLVLACDLPLAAPVLGRLAALPAGRAAMAADPDGRAQPLCARYPVVMTLAAADALLADGRPRLMGLVGPMAPLMVPATAEELLNVNTPGDLARAAARRGDPAWAPPPPAAPGAG